MKLLGILLQQQQSNPIIGLFVILLIVVVILTFIFRKNKKDKFEGNDKIPHILETNKLSGIEQIFTKKTSRKPQNIVSAGECIQSAVKRYVISFICFLVIIPLFVSFFISNIQALISGNIERALNEGGMQLLLIAILSVFGFVLWITSLVKLNNAGTLIKTSEAIYYKRGSIKVSPNRNIKEMYGFKIGQELLDGTIAYFDNTGRYAVIVAKSDLEEKMNQNDAQIACEKLNLDNNSDWYLPDVDELLVIYDNLMIKGIGNFAKDKYWSTFHEVDFTNGSIKYNSNNNLNFVRPIRVVQLF